MVNLVRKFDMRYNRATMRYVISILVIALGALITIKSEKLYSALGPVAWAEQHLGAEGGSRLFYKLIGIAIILFFFLYISGILQSLVVDFLGPLFGIR